MSGGARVDGSLAIAGLSFFPRQWQAVAAAFAVEKPGHMDGTGTRSFQFFDRAGAAALKVFVNFGGPIPPEREAQFNEVRTRFRR